MIIHITGSIITAASLQQVEEGLWTEFVRMIYPINKQEGQTQRLACQARSVPESYYLDVCYSIRPAIQALIYRLARDGQRHDTRNTKSSECCNKLLARYMRGGRRVKAPFQQHAYCLNACLAF